MPVVVKFADGTQQRFEDGIDAFVTGESLVVVRRYEHERMPAYRVSQAIVEDDAHRVLKHVPGRAKSSLSA